MRRLTRECILEAMHRPLPLAYDGQKRPYDSNQEVSKTIFREPPIHYWRSQPKSPS